MKRSIWRTILLTALDIVKPNKKYRKGILEGFKESYKEYGVNENSVIKISFIKRRQIKRKILANIMLARKSMLHNKEVDAGEYLGSAILQILYISISGKMQGEDVNETLKSLRTIRLEDMEAVHFINSLSKRLSELDKFSPETSLKRLVIIISLLIKFIGEKKKLDLYTLDEYKKAEKIHTLIYFPSAILIAILIIYLAYVFLLPLLAFISAPVAALIIRLDRKYFRLKRVLRWYVIDV